MYLIRSLCHRTDISMGRHGFIIDLHPSVKDMVAKSWIDQEKIETMLDRLGRIWLDRAGYDRIFDPDNCGMDADEKAPPGPNARPAYQPNKELRVDWGEWGLEHINVPGDACGLDIDRSSFGCAFKGGTRLVPHNMDSWSQKYLTLITFTEIMETLVYSQESA